MDISSLRKNRSTSFEKVVQGFDTGSGNYQKEDDNFWKVTRDKAGNGSAVIRFLPSTEDDQLPWVRMFDHGFQGPTGKWYIEKSLATIGEVDPCGVLNGKLWDSGVEANKEQAREQKRRTSFISNILVVKDYGNPENNGKVFRFKYGKKIFDMLQAKAKPTFVDQDPVNVFDLWEGANFRLRVAVKDGFPNYDQSEFDSASAIADSDDEILAIMKQAEPLSKLLDRANFKTYEELEARLKAVLGNTGMIGRSAEDLVKETLGMTETPKAAPAPTIKEAPAPEIKVATPKAEPAEFTGSSGSDDDLMDYFKSIG